MRQFVLFLFLLNLIMSCTNNSPKIHSDKKQLPKQEIVMANDSVTIYIEGMVCKMGCGGSIRKELKNTGAVEKCTFDFEEDRKENSATIYFDSTKITDKILIQHIESLNDKQFKAHI